jgi:hypothetical protein
MEKKYKGIVVIDGVTNGIVSITKHYACEKGNMSPSDGEMEYFRFHMSSDCISPNHFDLNKEDAENVIREIRHQCPVYIGITDGLDDVVDSFDCLDLL